MVWQGKVWQMESELGIDEWEKKNGQAEGGEGEIRARIILEVKMWKKQ